MAIQAEIAVKIVCEGKRQDVYISGESLEDYVMSSDL